jgi:hypothetical protein
VSTPDDKLIENAEDLELTGISDVIEEDLDEDISPGDIDDSP